MVPSSSLQVHKRASVVLAFILAACGGVPLGPPDHQPPVVTINPGAPAPATPSPAASIPEAPASPPTTATSPVAPPSPVTATDTAPSRLKARWVPVSWAELPGWNNDRVREVWPALSRGCEKPAPMWAALCAQARTYQPSDDAALRGWLAERLQPYRVEAGDGQSEGLATGYFEPQIDAVRTPREGYRVALHGPPADLATRKPYWTRQQLETLPEAQASLRGREIAWVADPLDVLLLQVQGSGRLRITERDGKKRLVRVAYAGHNDQPYKSVGRWLIEQGELRPGEASWPAIRDWARRNPKRVNELIWSNPRTVFFREEPLPDAAVGPRGAQGVPLTPGRSVAVDAQHVPYGTPLWLDTTEPLSQTPLRRLVFAQDTGSAIIGAVRIDYFWGWGSEAEMQAGRMKQPLRLWALWPKDSHPTKCCPGP